MIPFINSIWATTILLSGSKPFLNPGSLEIDKFGDTLKNYAELKTAWKGEPTNSGSEMTAWYEACGRQCEAMISRNVTGRRLNNAQNQFVTKEAKIVVMNHKSLAAHNKWEAKVKSYESRMKVAEERLKQERQGSKERVVELGNNLRARNDSYS